MRYYLLLLIILAALLLFFHLGERPLLSSGEARAGEIALEMMQTGNIFVPRLNEEIILTKPPLFHWLIILCYKIFGVSEFSSRVVSALSGILVIILVYLFGKRFWDKKTGFIAGLFLLTSPLFFWSARCARIDSLLVFLITMSMYCFWRGYEAMPSGRLWFVGWFLFMGLGVFAKGPVGLVVPLLSCILFLLFIKKQSLLKKLNWLWGLIIFFIVISPWFIAICFMVPRGKAELFFVQQNYAWIEGGGEWYRGYVYIPHLFLGFFPWSIALPLTLVCSFRDFRYRRDEKAVFLWIWMLVVFFIFAFFGKKVSRYILPLYPAVSLITARIISERKYFSRIFLYTLTSVCLFMILAVNLYPKFLEPELVLIIRKYIDSLWISAVGLFMIILGICGIRKKCLIISIIIIFIMFLIFVAYAIPVERDYYSPKPFCEMLKKEIPENAEIKAYQSWDNTIRYYFGRHVSVMHKEEELVEFLKSQKKVYCFMWDTVYESLPLEIKEKLLVIKSGYKVLEHKVVLLSNNV